MSSLTGKVALITGSSKGIGAAIAQNLASRGASIVINYSASSSSANAVVASLPPDTKSIAIKADVGSVGDCNRLVSETLSHFGRLDILILNAAWMPLVDIGNTTEDVFDRCMAINVKGPYFLTKAAAPHLPEDGSGRVIFFSSSLTAASTVTPNYTLYITTKGAIEQMTRAISKDLGKRNILVNVVSPGPTATDLFMRGKSESTVKAIAGLNPSNRIGTPEEVAQAVGFLAGEEAGWVNGQNLRVNGGFA